MAGARKSARLLEDIVRERDALDGASGPRVEEAPVRSPLQPVQPGALACALAAPFGIIRRDHEARPGQGEERLASLKGVRGPRSRVTRRHLRDDGVVPRVEPGVRFARQCARLRGAGARPREHLAQQDPDRKEIRSAP